MWALLIAVASASLVGSLHCVGMCGGLLGACVGCQKVSPTTQVHYHVARGIVYLLLGGAAGALGATVEFTGELASLQTLAAWLAGGVLVFWGALQLRSGLIGASKKSADGPTLFARGVGWILRKWPGKTPTARAWGLGLASALLPCGWLYSFVLVAAATASAATGVLVMGVFWLGTVPALAGIAWGVRRWVPSLQQRLPHLVPLVWIALGVVTIVERERLDLSELHATVAGAGVSHESTPGDSPESIDSEANPEVENAEADLLGQVRQLQEQGAPCCREPDNTAPTATANDPDVSAHPHSATHEPE